VKNNIYLAILLSLVLSACDPKQPADEEQTANEANESVEAVDHSAHQVNCDSEKGISPYCGFKNPEDIALTPDGRQLIISEMGEFMMDSPGSLSLFDLGSNQKQPISIDWQTRDDFWGDLTCGQPDPALFSPHGIDLTKRSDGRHWLLVVNHGGREAVEMFELKQTEGNWGLTWKGCAQPPEDPFINDVSGLPDGGLLVTHMWNKSLTIPQISEMLQKGETMGWVWEWHVDSGFTKLGGSQQMMPNGIAVSADGSKVFVNIYLGNKTIRIDRKSGTVEGEFEVRQPDNVVLDKGGNLWVASHQHDPINQNCNDVEHGPCLLPFVIVKADSSSMAAETVFSQEGLPMGYATVAFPAGERLFMGSAHGDRLISVPLESLSASESDVP